MPDMGRGPISLGESGAPLSMAGFPVGSAPIQPAARFTGGVSIERPGAYAGGEPVGGPGSLFNIGGAPIAVLGGVFSGGLPIGGPVTQIFRGGSAPQPNTLFVSTVTPAGPIGQFLLGTSGAPIGVEAFGGGGLPIGAPPAVQREEEILQPRTALVAQLPEGPAPALFISQPEQNGAPTGGSAIGG